VPSAQRGGGIDISTRVGVKKKNGPPGVSGFETERDGSGL